MKIPRAFDQWKEFNTPEYFFAYYKLMYLARFKEAYIDGVEVKVNQILISKTELAKQLGYTLAQTRRILDNFTRAGGIKTENIRNKYTLITVLEPFLSGERKPHSMTGKSSTKSVPEKITEIKVSDNIENICDDEKIKAENGKTAYGKFNNVYLTDDEYYDFCRETKNADNYINSLSAYLVNNTGKSYNNHYALLLNKIYEEQLKGGFAGKEKEEPKCDPNVSYDLKRAEDRARQHVPKLVKRKR